MQKFFLKLTILVVPFILLVMFFEYKLGKIPNGYNTKRANFEAQLDSIEVLVLGSSQSLFAVNPAYFDLKGFNLSNISQPLFYDKELVLKYVDKMPKLKCVIISISYFSFEWQLIDGIEPWRDYFYAQFWQIRYPEIKWYDLKLYSKLLLYTPRTSLEYALRLFQINLAQGLDKNGWRFKSNRRGSQKVNESHGKARVEVHDKYSKESRFQENVVILEQLVSEIKKRNIRMVMISTPVFETYSIFADKNKLERNRLATEDLCNKYHCEYYNYFTDSRFNLSDFADSDHLNYIGAEKFSRLLNDEILAKYFKK